MAALRLPGPPRPLLMLLLATVLTCGQRTPCGSRAHTPSASSSGLPASPSLSPSVQAMRMEPVRMLHGYNDTGAHHR